MRSAPVRSIAAVAAVRRTRERRPCRSVSSQPPAMLRASACRAACGLCCSAPSAAMSVSCHTASSSGRTYSPSIVSRTERAAGAPTDRRRSCSSIHATLAALMDAPNPASIALRRRIEWMDTDAAGIYHWTTAFRLAEAAEAALHTALGFADITFGATPRVRVQANFQRPLKFNDEVDVALRVKRVGRTSVEYSLTITGPDGPAVEGRITAAFIDRETRRATPWPDEIRALLNGGGTLGVRSKTSL